MPERCIFHRLRCEFAAFVALVTGDQQVLRDGPCCLHGKGQSYRAHTLASARAGWLPALTCPAGWHRREWRTPLGDGDGGVVHTVVASIEHVKLLLHARRQRRTGTWRLD